MDFCQRRVTRRRCTGGSRWPRNWAGAIRLNEWLNERGVAVSLGSARYPDFWAAPARAFSQSVRNVTIPLSVSGW